MNNKLWQSLANSWKIPELRKKLLFTAAMIAIYRFGSHVPVPGVNLQALNNLFQNGAGGVLGFLNLFSGGALNKVAIFALGIMPYITASIIMQLLTVVIPKLEELQKEGEQGQKIITQYSRYLTVILAAVQSVGYIFLFRSQGALPNLTVVRFALILFTLTAGATAVMWIGELITARGIGNGMSILIFISIISRVPGGVQKFFEGSMSLLSQTAFVIIALGVIVGVIWITTGERRIPVQYAKRVVGRKVMGGGSTHLPLRVNSGGVMPVIFASSLLTLPQTAGFFLRDNRYFGPLLRALSWGEPLYTLLYAIGIIFFAYFYVSIVFNPNEVADNMRKYGGFIPGIRPGKRTADSINEVLTRITLVGAFYLIIISFIPEWMIAGIHLNHLPGALGAFFEKLPAWVTNGLGVTFYFGGTSLLIVVGVAMDTVQQVEAQLIMRHYEGFTPRSGRIRGRRTWA